METFSFHYKTYDGKSGNWLFFRTNCRYLNFVFAEMFIDWSSMFLVTFVLILYFDSLLGPHKGQNFKKYSKNLFLRNCQGDEACTLFLTEAST